MEWITDRPPDKNGKYLVTGRQGGISILSYTDGSWCRKWAVIAWMPLPVPYRKERSDEIYRKA